MSDETNPKDLLGIKKAPLRLVPPALLIETAPALTLGAEKYGPYNWREKDVRLTVYLEALLRHVLAYADRQDLDPESGASHLSHAAACLAIIFDAKACGRLVDDRFTAGAAAELLAAQDRSKVDTGRPCCDASHPCAEGGCEYDDSELRRPAERRQPQQLVTKCDDRNHTPLPHFHHATPPTDEAEDFTELVEYGDGVARVVPVNPNMPARWPCRKVGHDGCECWCSHQSCVPDDSIPRGKRDGRNCGPGDVHAHDRYCAHNDDRTDDEVLADVTRRYP